MTQELAPIVLFCYNRLNVLQQTVEALKKNKLAENSNLIIFSDGAKSGQEEKVNQVRNYIHSINGFKSIEIIEQKENKGLANSIIDGVTQVINKYERIIVLEDDLLVSPYFLNYMNDALNMYENNDEVACITGYTYPLKGFGYYPQSFFLKGAECWSWATWKRSWDLFEKDGQKLLDLIVEQHLESDFDFDNSYFFLRMLKDQINGKNDSWAIRWYASCYLANKLCLYLSKPIVNNIGFGVDGTHCKSATKNFDVNINQNPVKLKKIKIQENKKMRKEFVKYFNSLKKTKSFYTHWYEHIFSAKNNNTHKIITVLGIKIKL